MLYFLAIIRQGSVQIQWWS